MQFCISILFFSFQPKLWVDLSLFSLNWTAAGETSAGLARGSRWRLDPSHFSRSSTVSRIWLGHRQPSHTCQRGNESLPPAARPRGLPPPWPSRPPPLLCPGVPAALGRCSTSSNKDLEGESISHLIPSDAPLSLPPFGILLRLSCGEEHSVLCT